MWRLHMFNRCSQFIVANILLSSPQHRCMQGKDSPGRTVDNDRRIKKKLDVMLKDRLPKLPNGKKPSPPGVWFIKIETLFPYSETGYLQGLRVDS